MEFSKAQIKKELEKKQENVKLNGKCLIIYYATKNFLSETYLSH